MTFGVGDRVRCRPITTKGETGVRDGVIDEVDLAAVTRWPYAVKFPDQDNRVWYMPGELTLLEKAAPLTDGDVDDYCFHAGCGGECKLSVPVAASADTPALELLPSGTPEEVGTVLLDPTDPFERVLVDIVTTNRRKRADYAVDGSPWSNFEFTAGVLNMPAVDAAVHNVAQKLARLTSLRANGRMADPANEAVTDTYLDMAVYATIAYAIHRYPEGKVV